MIKNNYKNNSLNKKLSNLSLNYNHRKINQLKPLNKNHLKRLNKKYYKNKNPTNHQIYSNFLDNNQVYL